MANGPSRSGQISRSVFINGQDIGTWANIYVYATVDGDGNAHSEVNVDSSFVRNGIAWYFSHWEFSGSVPPGFRNDGGTHQVSEIYQAPFGDFVAHAMFVAESPTQDSAINLTLVSSPLGVGTLTGGGLKSGAVGSAVTYNVAATVSSASQDRYRFSHWIDDEGVRHGEKQFSKSFVLKDGHTVANPEQKTFTAYFVPFTGLILRSANSGLILRGSNNTILRDE